MSLNVPIENWHGCYDRSWKGILVEDSFSHPAKFSRGLIEKIIYTGLERGWWKKGELIGDPFGGVACGGIVASYAGMRWEGVELEDRFWRIAQRNIDRHDRERRSLGLPRPYIIKGDSRRFSAHICNWPVNGAGGIVTSPPYADAESTRAGGPRTKFPDGRNRTTDGQRLGYGQTPGQIGALPAGSCSGVVTSPPYAESNQDYKAGWKYIDDTKSEHARSSRLRDDGRYGDAAGQIASLPSGCLDGVVTSPPWEDQEGALNANKVRDPAKFAEATSRLDGANGRHGTQVSGR